MTPTETPNDTQLLLLCRDYLLDLRRNNDEVALATKKNMDADYISLAIFSLNRSILRPDYLANTKKPEDIFATSSQNSNSHKIPHITKINNEILTPREDMPRPYDVGYNDVHPSNLYRFYPLNGLGSAPENGPLELDELVTAGLHNMSARCRLEAEKDIIKCPQFELYIESVTAKGYFQDPENSGKRKDQREEERRRARKAQVYKDKYRKAIAKYREKLAVDVRLGCDTRMGLLSPPCSPNLEMRLPQFDMRSQPDMGSRKTSNNPRRDSRSFHSPPRSCQIPTLRGVMSPVSPLTPNAAGERRSSSRKKSRTPTTKSTPTSSRSVKESPRSVKASPRSVRESPRSVKASPRLVKESSNSMPPRDTHSPIPRSRPVKETMTSPKQQHKKTLSTTPSFDSVNTSSNASSSNVSTISSGKSLLDGVNRNRRRNIVRNKNLARTDRPSSTQPDKTEAAPKKAPEMEEKSVKPPTTGTTHVASTQNDGVTERPPRKVTADLEITKAKPFSLYELHLVTSASSGMEVNAGSFVSMSPPDRRQKSEFEIKMEERQKRLASNSISPSLELPDIAGEGRCTSPVARIRSERNTCLSQGDEASQAATPVSSPRRVTKLAAGSWMTSSQKRSDLLIPNPPREEERKSSFIAAKKSALFDRTVNVNNSGITTKKSSPQKFATSPKTELKIDPFQFAPPKIISKIGGGTRSFANKVEVDQLDTGLPRLTSPRVGLISPRARSSQRASPLKRAC